MKNINFFITTAIILLLSFSAEAQINKATIEKHLPGTWEIASDDDLKVLEDGEDMFLGRNITFKENHGFSKGDSVKLNWNVEGEDQIFVVNYAEHDGAMYQILTLNEKELVFDWGGKKVAYKRVEE